MAGSKEEVDRVLGLLLERAKPSQDEELESLAAFAQEKGFKTDRYFLYFVVYIFRVIVINSG